MINEPTIKDKIIDVDEDLEKPATTVKKRKVKQDETREVQSTSSKRQRKSRQGISTLHEKRTTRGSSSQ